MESNAATLEELWLSYNQISSLDGLSNLPNLTTLYLSNNAIKAWSELDKLVGGIMYLGGFIKELYLKMKYKVVCVDKTI